MTTEHNPYLQFTREQWALLRDSVPLTLTEHDLQTLRGINEKVSLQEVEEIYLPLSRLLNLYVKAKQRRSRVLEQFLGQSRGKGTYIISIAGSVAGGKSTTARIMQALLERWPEHPRVELVTTDGFLYPNKVLEERGLMRRKGFPESYDIRHLVEFVANIRAGHEKVEAPVYSHLIYDIIPDEKKVVEQPDILILEGLNVLQSGMDYPQDPHRVFVSDFVDFSIMWMPTPNCCAPGISSVSSSFAAAPSRIRTPTSTTTPSWPRARRPRSPATSGKISTI